MDTDNTAVVCLRPSNRNIRPVRVSHNATIDCCSRSVDKGCQKMCVKHIRGREGGGGG